MLRIISATGDTDFERVAFINTAFQTI